MKDIGAESRDLRTVEQLIRTGNWQGADQACGAFCMKYPHIPEGWFAASRIAMAVGRPERALQAAEEATRIDPSNIKYKIHCAWRLLAAGRRGDALAVAVSCESLSAMNAAEWDSVGTLRSRAGDQIGALTAMNHAVASAPDNPNWLHDRATVRRFIGDLEGAEADYDRAIGIAPLRCETLWNRSELRRQTLERNHIADLESSLKHALPPEGEVQVRFALAKELEDVGRFVEAFNQLRIGAQSRRARLQYDVKTDVRTVDWIIKAFPTPLVHSAATRDTSWSSEAPIFVVGLPRSGTTLVDRILSSHSQLTSVGEVDCFAHAIVETARRLGGQSDIPRKELVALAAHLDWPVLGKEYLRRVRGLTDVGGPFIDKMPLNYLYCGLIHRALPKARIIHVTRYPMAVCYAIYKTLFKGGYPFSYDFAEIAQYYGAYRRLMEHWQRTLPNLIWDVNYEALIADREAVTRDLLSKCDLDFEPPCLTFHENSAPSMTASASQVRRPLYDSSVAQWRHYESQLTELRQHLLAVGVPL
jgi:hypothetical protein